MLSLTVVIIASLAVAGLCEDGADAPTTMTRGNRAANLKKAVEAASKACAMSDECKDKEMAEKRACVLKCARAKAQERLDGEEKEKLEKVREAAKKADGVLQKIRERVQGKTEGLTEEQKARLAKVKTALDAAKKRVKAFADKTPEERRAALTEAKKKVADKVTEQLKDRKKQLQAKDEEETAEARDFVKKCRAKAEECKEKTGEEKVKCFKARKCVAKVFKAVVKCKHLAAFSAKLEAWNARVAEKNEVGLPKIMARFDAFSDKCQKAAEEEPEVDAEDEEEAAPEEEAAGNEKRAEETATATVTATGDVEGAEVAVVELGVEDCNAVDTHDINETIEEDLIASAADEEADKLTDVDTDPSSSAGVVSVAFAALVAVVVAQA